MESITEETVICALYGHYLENLGPDRGEIARGFAELDRLLDELTRKEYDRVWGTSVALCSAHERRGFDAGFQMGASLMQELAELGQGRES